MAGKGCYAFPASGNHAARKQQTKQRKTKQMKLNKTDWIETIKDVVKKTQQKPSSGVVCAIASIVTLRDGIIADLPKCPPEIEEAITKSCKELMQQVASESTFGFAANASAAAAAAGFKAENKAASFDVDSF